MSCGFVACKEALVRCRALSAHFTDQSERSAAILNLKRLNKGDARVQVDDEFLSMYLAIRQMRGEHSRIAISMLLGRETNVVKSNSLRNQLWNLSKSRRPNLPHEIEPTFFVDHNLIEQKPLGPGANMEDACPQSAIGVGAFQCDTSVCMQNQAPVDTDTDTDGFFQPTLAECFRNATATLAHGYISQSTYAPTSSSAIAL